MSKLFLHLTSLGRREQENKTAEHRYCEGYWENREHLLIQGSGSTPYFEPYFPMIVREAPENVKAIKATMIVWIERTKFTLQIWFPYRKGIQELLE